MSTRIRTSAGRHLTRLARSEDGAALVEFAMVLPMMLIVFAVIVEGGRVLYAYQSTIAGVRDATRYLSRIVPADVCAASGGGQAAVTIHNPRLTTIVSQSTTGNTPFPGGVTVNSVTSNLGCISGTYRVDPAPVASVTANVTIDFPFGGMFSLFGATLQPVTTNVTDSSRIFGT